MEAAPAVPPRQQQEQRSVTSRRDPQASAGSAAGTSPPPASSAGTTKAHTLGSGLLAADLEVQSAFGTMEADHTPHSMLLDDGISRWVSLPLALGGFRVLPDTHTSLVDDGSAAWTARCKVPTRLQWVTKISVWSRVVLLLDFVLSLGIAVGGVGVVEENLTCSMHDCSLFWLGDLCWKQHDTGPREITAGDYRVALREEPPGSCVDLRTADGDEWEDSRGATCDAYAYFGFCGADGTAGMAWNPSFGPFAETSKGAFACTEACCACGGGVRTIISSLIQTNNTLWTQSAVQTQTVMPTVPFDARLYPINDHAVVATYLKPNSFTTGTLELSELVGNMYFFDISQGSTYTISTWNWWDAPGHPVPWPCGADGELCHKAATRKEVKPGEPDSTLGINATDTVLTLYDDRGRPVQFGDDDNIPVPWGEIESGLYHIDRVRFTALHDGIAYVKVNTFDYKGMYGYIVLETIVRNAVQMLYFLDRIVLIRLLLTQSLGQLLSEIRSTVSASEYDEIESDIRTRCTAIARSYTIFSVPVIIAIFNAGWEHAGDEASRFASKQASEDASIGVDDFLHATQIVEAACAVLGATSVLGSVFVSLLNCEAHTVHVNHVVRSVERDTDRSSPDATMQSMIRVKAALQGTSKRLSRMLAVEGCLAMALLLLVLVRFKQTNDTHAHFGGTETGNEHAALVHTFTAFASISLPLLVGLISIARLNTRTKRVPKEITAMQAFTSLERHCFCEDFARLDLCLKLYNIELSQRRIGLAVAAILSPFLSIVVAAIVPTLKEIA